MERKSITLDKIQKNTATMFQNWMLLTAGENAPGKFNAMTIGWGFLGFAWGKPIAVTLVRHHRYTFEFMERAEDFTICSFPPQYRDALNLLGTKSGRDGDKVAASGLTPVASKIVRAPAYAEADLVLECKKAHFYDMREQDVAAKWVLDVYPGRDFHKMYFGEIVHVEEA
ncbi:MAG: flavin reductase [Clostridiales bacterium]|jgi:flavin reductase (DIM6/NTAB) family NADH-FMN oxidoreductase RutF|nr:flavin reductase [Clostridiales bacterium]